MRALVAPAEKMDIVGSHQPHADIPGQLNQLPVGGLLLGDILILDFDIETFRSENIEIFAGDPAGVVVPSREQQLRNLAAKAGREAVRRDARDWSSLSLAYSVRGMEDKETLYTVRDLKLVFS